MPPPQPLAESRGQDFTDRARCLGCGYALRGLAEPRCPECGRTFDPNDPMTMRVPGVSRRKPPKPVPFAAALIVVAVVVALVTTVGLHSPSGEVTVIGLLGWFGVFVFWQVRNHREGAAAERGEPLPNDGPRHWRKIVLAVFVLSMLTGFGLHRCPHGRYYRYGPIALFRSSGVGGGGGGPCRNVMAGRPMQLSANWYLVGP